MFYFFVVYISLCTFQNSFQQICGIVSTSQQIKGHNTLMWKPEGFARVDTFQATIYHDTPDDIIPVASNAVGILW
jgi:hypothetical protein